MTQTVAPAKILFVTSTRIGDAVLSSGLLSHLVETRPDARFTIACGKVTASLFEGVPRLDRVIAMTKGKYAAHWRHLWSECIGTRWDTIIDLRRSALVWTLFAKNRIRLQEASGNGHRVEENGRVLGLVPPPSPKLWTLPEHDARAEQLIPSGVPVLAVGPSANWRGKTWRAGRFIEVVERLTAVGAPFENAKVAVFAAENEREIAAPVLHAIPEDRRIDAIGESHLLSVYAALSRCQGYIGNDSGLMHMAAAADVPTLGLFGPSRAEHYAPWGDHAAFVRTPQSFDELVGGPGYNHRTTDTLMDGLTVDAVVDAAQALFSKPFLTK